MHLFRLFGEVGSGHWSIGRRTAHCADSRPRSGARRRPSRPRRHPSTADLARASLPLPGGESPRALRTSRMMPPFFRFCSYFSYLLYPIRYLFSIFCRIRSFRDRIARARAPRAPVPALRRHRRRRRGARPRSCRGSARAWPSARGWWKRTGPRAPGREWASASPSPSRRPRKTVRPPPPAVHRDRARRERRLRSPAARLDSRPRGGTGTARQNARGLDRAIQHHARAHRDLRRDPALHRGRLPGIGLDPCREHSGPWAPRPRQALRQAPQGHLASAPSAGLETNPRPPGSRPSSGDAETSSKALSTA